MSVGIFDLWFLLCNGVEIFFVDGLCLLFGFMKVVEYEVVKWLFEVGDCVVFVIDGFFEVIGVDGELFGYECLICIFEEYCDVLFEEFVESFFCLV